MSAENRVPATDDRPRRLVALVTAFTLVVVALIISQATAGRPAEQTAGASVTAASEDVVEAAPAANVGRAAPEIEAEKALRSFLRASDKAYQRADGTSKDVTGFATQAMIDEVRNQSLDLAAQKIEQTGNVTVVKISSLASSDSEVDFGACLSTAKIETLDVNGSDLRASQSLETRSLHHYTVVLVDGAWKVSAHSFPNNADC